MKDEFLISKIRGELDFVASRGMPTFSTLVETLVKRFETLRAAHKLLGEREERLTNENVALKDSLDTAENWIKRNESGVQLG